jgi:SAM-dependent methyltransferase
LSRDWFEYFNREGVDNFPLFLYNYYTFRMPTVGCLVKHLPSGGSILEIGCGTALLAILLSSMGYDVTGIDSDVRVVEMARRNNERLGGRAVVEQVDLFDAPRRLRRVYDLVYSEGVVEHFRGKKLMEAVRIHGDVGTTVMIVVPNRYDPAARDQDIYGYRELEDLCRQAGLTPIDRLAIGVKSTKLARLLPHAIQKRLWGALLECDSIGVVCKSWRGQSP